MRNKKYTKLMFSLLIIFLMLFISNIAYALNANKGTGYDSILNAAKEGNLGVNYTDVLMRNKYVFCRQQGVTFPRSGYHNYYAFEETEVHNNDRWSFLFRGLEGANMSNHTTNKDKPYQKIIWDTMPNGTTTGVSTWGENDGNEKYLAQLYEDTMKKFDLDNLQAEIYTESPIIEGETITIPVQIKTKNKNGEVVGYPYLNNNNTKDFIGGIKNFAVRNGKGDLIPYKIYYKDGQQEVTIWESTEQNKSSILSVWSTSDRLNDMISACNMLSEQNSKDVFYINVKAANLTDDKKIQITAISNILKTAVEFTYIKTDNKFDVNEFVRCSNHTETANAFEIKEGEYPGLYENSRCNQKIRRRKSKEQLLLL